MINDALQAHLYLLVAVLCTIFFADKGFIRETGDQSLKSKSIGLRLCVSVSVRVVLFIFADLVGAGNFFHGGSGPWDIIGDSFSRKQRRMHTGESESNLYYSLFFARV